MNQTPDQALQACLCPKAGRLAYQDLFWQCRSNGIDVPDALWPHAKFGVGMA
jgi:hypothetical protein